MNKQEFDKKYVCGGLLVHCKNEKLANKFLKLAHSFGYKWRSGDSYLLKNNYSEHKTETCYDIYNGEYCDLSYYTRCFDTYEIIEYKGEVMKYTFKDFEKNNLFIKINNEIEGNLFYEWLHEHNYSDTYSKNIRKDVIKSISNKAYTICCQGHNIGLPLEVGQILATVYDLEGIEKEKDMTAIKEGITVLNNGVEIEITKEIQDKILSDIKQQEVKVWNPTEGEKYQYVDDCGDVMYTTWKNDKSDNYRFNTRNMFKTEEECEYKKQRDLLLGRIEIWALKNNDSVIGWGNEEQVRWYFYHNHNDMKLGVSYTTNAQRRSTYFTSEELVRKAIKHFREDIIKKYIFNIK